MTRDTKLDCRISGAQSPDGVKLIAIEQRGCVWYTNLATFVSDPAASVRDLAEQGLWVGGQAHIAKMLEAIRGIERFSPVDVLNAPGWSGPVFARSDGKVFVPSKARALGKPPGIGFFRHPGRHRHAGTLTAWKDDVAPTLLSDDVAALIVSMALAPVVRPLISRPVPPFGLQIVAGHDRTTFRTIAETVIGSMDPTFLAGDPIQKLIAQPERYVAASKDSLLVLDDVVGYLCGSADKKRRAAVRALMFDQLLPSGVSGNNSAGRAAPMFLLIESTPVQSSLELDAAASDRLAGTLLTIDLTQAGPQLQFRRPEWAKAVNATFHLYGTPLRRFQQRIVGTREKRGIKALQAELDKRFRRFRSQARRSFSAPQLPGPVLDRFALLYTAFSMAERLDVLPSTGTEPPLIWTALKRFMADQPKPPTAAAILKDLAARPDVLAVDDVDLSMSKEQIKRVPAFVSRSPTGEAELWVTTTQKKQVFDWPALRKLPDFDDWYLGGSERGRNGVKRVVGEHSPRVVRFKLPQ